MPSMWEDIKKTVKDGLSVAAAKTEEVTRIGKAKLDLMTLNKSLNQAHADIGRAVVDLVRSKSKTPVAQDTGVAALLEKVDSIQAAIRDKEKELADIRKAGAAGAEEASEPVLPPEEPQESGTPGKGTRAKR